MNYKALIVLLLLIAPVKNTGKANEPVEKDYVKIEEDKQSRLIDSLTNSINEDFAAIRQKHEKDSMALKNLKKANGSLKQQVQTLKEDLKKKDSAIASNSSNVDTVFIVQVDTLERKFRKNIWGKLKEIQ